MGEDCNDDPASATATSESPGQPEICDGIRNDCGTALADVGAIAVPWYGDLDGDGFGSPLSGITTSCAPVVDASLLGTDCDDANAMRHPAAAEACNAIDDDCSGAPDALEVDADADGLLACEECDDSVVGMGEIPLYPDGDDDGHGDLAALDTGDTGLAGATLGCLGTPGTSPVADDCDDSAAYAYPGAVESCNLADDNCDGVVDEGFAAWCAAAVYDDFDAGVPDAAMWGPIVGDGFVSGTYSASPGFSLSLGGGVASIEMVPLDLTGCPQLAMELAVKRGPESPDATDYVRLERDAGGFWTAVWSLYGLGGTDVSFLPYSAVFTDPAVLAAGTRLRFASDGSSSTADDFFLDDVSISCDADLDGLGWYSEAQYGTDASAADTDGDGATDGDELLIRGTDPLDPASN